MGRTILCEKCKSTFNESVLANRENPNICPVCGESLLDDEENMEDSTHDEIENIDLEHPDMYFYDIEDEEDEEDEELREVWCQCTTCREVNTIRCNQFGMIKSEYVKLKDSVEICCKGCGKTVTNPIIPKRPDGWRELNMWEKDYNNLPKCPICHSTKIHKISMTNKAASALTFGIFAVVHVSKTWKCEVCGSKF